MDWMQKWQSWSVSPGNSLAPLPEILKWTFSIVLRCCFIHSFSPLGDLHSGALKHSNRDSPNGISKPFFLEVSIVRDHIRKSSDCEAFGASASCYSSSCWLETPASLCTFPLPPLIHQFHPVFSLCAHNIRLVLHACTAVVRWGMGLPA